MSTTAVIFMKDKATERYFGCTVNFDGYVEGVGKTLLEYWTDEDKVKKLCFNKNLDIRILGSDIESTEFFPMRKDRKNRFYNLTFDQMMNEIKQWDYGYYLDLFGDDTLTWWLYNKKNEGFIPVKNLLSQQE